MRRVPENIPVLIVGGGPVGLALALDLGLMGVRCALIEQREGTVTLPKMNTVSTRTMEFCRRWGVASKIREIGFPGDHPHDVRFVTSLSGHELHRFEFPSYQERGCLGYTPEGPCICSQLWFDPILLDRVRELTQVSVFLKMKLAGFEQDQNGIRADVIDLESGRRQSLSVLYLVGCDGAESVVRELAGIELDGDHLLNTNLNIFFRSRDLISLSADRPARMHRIVGPEGMWGNLNPIDGRELWRVTVQLRGGATPESVDVGDIIRRVAGRPVEFEILSAFPWERRKVIARHYRNGRVFLAGDSAHQMSTTGGFGMNTGAGDAVDLAWKLDAMLKGWGGPYLLDSYEIERKAIALRNMEEAAQTFRLEVMLPGGQEIVDDSPAGQQLRNAFAKSLLDYDLRREYEVEGITLGYRYDHSPLIWPDGTLPPRDEVQVYTPSARPGSRAPHAWLSHNQSLLDVFFASFTLLCFGEAPVETNILGLVEAAKTRGVPLKVVKMQDLEVRKLYEQTLVLVRPDGHVCWRSNMAPDNPMAVIDRVRGGNRALAA